MRLKRKLVASATGLTLAIVAVLSGLFLCELLKQRIIQTEAETNVMAHQVENLMRKELNTVLGEHPPEDSSNEAVHQAIVDALQVDEPLKDMMQSFVTYSPAVEDVSVTDMQGRTLMTTAPEGLGKVAPPRRSFGAVKDSSVWDQLWVVMRSSSVLDNTASIGYSGKPILTVHVGVRSVYLREKYRPRLEDGAMLAALCAGIAMLAAGLLANVALRPIEEISRRLERLTADPSEESGSLPELGDGGVSGRDDAVVRVTNTIDRLGRQIRTTEAVYTDLQANLNQMLDTLRDGVVLFTAEQRAVMVSDAVAHFVNLEDKPLVGLRLGEIFAEHTALGRAVALAFEREGSVTAETVRMEDGREVEFTLDRIDDGKVRARRMGTLLTLRDRGSAAKLEHELEVSRRLAAVGRLTAGVGHEVKNPINAMVVHLELLRSKLEVAGAGRSFLIGAQRHVEIISGEMQRLDHVVQTLADFTRPMELKLEEMDLCDVVEAVVELTGAEMQEQQVQVKTKVESVMVRADGEMLRQALLNLVLNGMQAMSGEGREGGLLRIAVRKEQEQAVIEIADDGEGIAPELMPKIFDLYFTTKPKGSGIGLAMTYRIVQMHGGSMEVRSEAGQGAVFTLRLPALKASDLWVPAARQPVGEIA